MKKNIISAILSFCIVIPLFTTLSGCSSDNLFKKSATVVKNISSDKAYTVGSTSKTGWQLDIPKGTFDSNEELTMNVLSAEDSRKFSGDAELVGGVVDISIKSKEAVRLNAPVTVKMKLPADIKPTDEDFDNYVGAYYTENGWEYIIPDAEQLKKGYISFETFHFSTFGSIRLTDQQKVELYANKMATDSWYRESKEAALSKSINDMLSDTLDKMGISDSTMKGKVLRSIAKKNNYGNLFVSAEKGDLADFTAKCGEMAANSVLEVNSKLASTGASVFSTTVKASEKLYNGDYKGAGKEITNAFIKSFPAGKAFEAVVKITDTGINLWTDSEVEAAYRAYSGQMKPGEYGYSVSKGDWDSLTMQMRGIAHRLQNKEKERYCTVNNITMSQLDADKTLSERLANQALSNLKKQFDTRMANEDTIAAKKADILKQIETFKNEGFLTRGNLNYDYETDVGDRLRTLFKLRENILDMFDGSMPFDSGKGENAEENLKLAMGKWLSYGTNDRSEFYQWLKEKGWFNEKASSVSGDGYWKLVATNFNEAESVTTEIIKADDRISAYSYEIHPGGGSMSTTFMGETVAATFTFSVPSILVSGETFSMKLGASDVSNRPDDPLSNGMGGHLSLNDGGYWRTIDYGICGTNGPGNRGEVWGSHGEATYDFTAPGKADGFIIRFDILSALSPGSLKIDYVYEYVEGTPPEAYDFIPSGGKVITMQ